MPHFRPERSSPPIKLQSETTIRPALLSDISRSSATSAHELSSLSQEEIELIDLVVKRAGPSATTFLTVFKAYNDVLVERGLDPHEVVYYGKLLKLGTIKGKNWGEKWKFVKCLYYSEGSRSSCIGSTPFHAATQAPTSSLNNVSNHVPFRMSSPTYSEDTFTLHSHEKESVVNTGDVSDCQHAPLPPFFLKRQACSDSSSFPDATKAFRAGLVEESRSRHHVFDLKDSESDVSDSVPSVPLPTYQVSPSPHIVDGSCVVIQLRPNRVAPDEARKAVAIARERRGTVVNGDIAWRKIKMQRDEADADLFREDRLQERCWDVWKQGFLWVITTSRQIGEARDNLILRLSLQRWRTRSMSRRELLQRIAQLSNQLVSKRAFDTWKICFRRKQRRKWRFEMLSKMNIVKRAGDARLIRLMWRRWCQAHNSQLSILQYSQSLQHRFYNHWKLRLSAIIKKEAIALDFFENTGLIALERSWHIWKASNYLRHLEGVMADRVELRLMTKTWLLWRKKFHDFSTAREFRNTILFKIAIGSWKAARDRILSLQHRSLKHLARQDNVLICAIVRVWRAQERGRLLKRVKTTRLLRSTLMDWRNRVRRRKEDGQLALAFYLRTSSCSIALALQKWFDAFITHGNASTFAAQYHSSQLERKMILLWRIRLCQNLKLFKLSLRADEIFKMRRTWRIWNGVLKARSLGRIKRALERRKVKCYFHAWALRAREDKSLRMIGQIVQDYLIERTLKRMLDIWTNRVIEIKLRQLEVGQRYDNLQLSFAFKKWKALHERHVERQRLMESYQYVKKEEMTRHLFRRWLSLAVTTRRRRLTLQVKEEEFRSAKLSVLWNKWRGRFIDEKLRPIEHNVIQQTRRNLLFRAFGIWHSNTKSLPAIRFHTSNTRYKYFKCWRGAMPRAMQMKQAREIDRRALYSRFTNLWLQRVRTKRALKAVARARYLRLPVAVPRQSRPSAMGLPAVNSSWLVVPRPDADKEVGKIGGRIASRQTRTGSSRSRESGDLPVTTGAGSSPTGWRTINSRGRRTGNVSPTRSIPGSVISAKSEDMGRISLWRELREVQKKTGPPSSRGRLG